MHETIMISGVETGTITGGTVNHSTMMTSVYIVYLSFMGVQALCF